VQGFFVKLAKMVVFRVKIVKISIYRAILDKLIAVLRCCGARIAKRLLYIFNIYAPLKPVLGTIIYIYISFLKEYTLQHNNKDFSLSRMALYGHYLIS